MVRHQAPRPHLDRGGATGGGKTIAIEGIVLVAEKPALTAIAALRDMVGQTGDDDTGEASKGRPWRDGGGAPIKCTVIVIPALDDRECRLSTLLGCLGGYIAGKVRSDGINVCHGTIRYTRN